MAAQGGRKAAQRVAQQHALIPQVLEMLADMRQQFANMLADINFIPSPPQKVRGSQKQKGCVALPTCLDGSQHHWNTHAAEPTVVRLCVAHMQMSLRREACQSYCQTCVLAQSAGEARVLPSLYNRRC